jgi:pyruvate/2-oxoglutarate dehydrogenase complex dihydrolipoamide acyltransferase (E2) component
MPRRVAMKVEVQGLHISFEGGEELYESVMRRVLAPLAQARWRAPLVLSGPALPTIAEAPSGPAASAHPAPAPAARPGLAAAVAAPAPAPDPAAGAAPAFDPAPFYARLAAEAGRRAEKDAVLLALVSLGVAGKRDSTPAEVLAHLEAHGYPTEDLKPRPILAKLCHRKGLAAPGILPNTFRATPAGSAHVWRRSREG